MKTSLLAFLLAAAPFCAANVTVPADFDVAVTLADSRKAPSRADGDETPAIDFTYAGEPMAAYHFRQAKGAKVYLAFQFTPAMATAYAGNTITALNATTGAYVLNGIRSNRITDINVFITEDLNGEPFYSQTGKLGTSAYTQYAVDLQTPYVIEAGKGFYMGYWFNTTESYTTKREYYACADGDTGADPAGCWIGIVKNGATVWEQLADQYGALNMGCRIVGESLPVNGVDVLGVLGTDYAEPGVAFSNSLNLRGCGANSPETIEVTYTIGSDAPKTVAVPVAGGIAYGEEKTVVVPGLVYDKEQLETPVSLEVTRVNGADNFSTRRSGSSQFDCFPRSKGFDRLHLVEEATGTWCGWCPRGIVALEYLKEKYSDKFVAVALHGTDEMSKTSTTSMIQALGIPGYPYMIIDRVYGDDPGYYKSYFDPIAARNYPAVMRISSLEASVSEKQELTIDTKVQFSYDTDNSAGRYRLAYYLTEDGVGPYKQTNAYAGGASGVMGGWERKGSSVSTIYNEVGRAQLGGYSGFANSIPAQIVAGEEYAYATTSGLKDITNGKFTVIAFIVDTKTGQVVNAARIEAENPYFSSIGEVEAPEAEAGEWYDLHGRRVASPSSGLYILRRGSTATKVLVK